jgi:murein DD-endopeptidase MepM/ murein hydrolase activator NlpD
MHLYTELDTKRSDNDRLLEELVSSRSLNSIFQGNVNSLLTQIDSLKTRQTTRIIRETLVVRDTLSKVYPSAQTDFTNNRFIPDSIPLTGNFAISLGFSEQHQAIDFATSIGRNVFAAAAGIVIACYDDRTLGNVIMIDHLNSYKTLYAHLNSFNVSIDDFVNKGQVIGTVGSTGNSTSPHLHFQIFFENDSVDPNDLMRIAKFSN